jgi:hypothetical protein
MMASVLRAFALLAGAAALYAQPEVGPQAASGMETPWQIAPVFEEISTHAARLLPALDQVYARAWVQRGASDTYATQLDSCKAQARAVADEAKVLAANPEKLSSSLTVFFRIQAIDAMLGTIEEGLRKYQSPADAQNLTALAAEGGASRDRLQLYLVNLAAEREKDYQVMDREAQRCRGLVTQPAAKPRAVTRAPAKVQAPAPAKDGKKQ